MTNETLLAAAEALRVVADTRFIMGGPTVETQGDITRLSIHFQPYNKAKLDTVHVWIEGNEATVSAAVNTPASVRGAGFLQSHVRATTDCTGMDGEALAAYILSLRGQME